MRAKVMAVVMIVVGVSLGLLVGPALAAEKAVVQAFLAANGSGELIAAENFREGKGWQWQACTADLSSCVSYAKGEETTTGSAAPETVFRATSRAGNSALSPVWHGNVTSLTPPAVRGELRANELIRPVPGTWSGGWDGDYDWTQLSACTTKAGTNCVTLTDQHFTASCKHGAAVLDPAFVADYLRVADRRVEAEAGIELYAVGTPYQGEVWEASPLTSVAIVGRIGAPKGPRRAKCGPAPITAKASISRHGVAQIQCTLGCRVTLIATRGGRTVRVRTQALVTTLKLSRQKIQYLGLGAVHISVLLDGRKAASRIVHDL